MTPPTPPALPFLHLKDVHVRFGGVAALDGVTFELRNGEILGLIGPNGAGKTTVFNCMSGLARPGRGDIVLNGKSLLKLPSHRIAAAGVARTFQHGALFSDMTVHQNILLGCHMRATTWVVGDALRLRSTRRTDRAVAPVAAGLIRRFHLQDVAGRQVKHLPFGLRKRVELARALAISPTVLLLDEPACGLNHDEVSELGRLVMDIRDRDGVSIILVEHHMGLVLQIADRIVALNFGRKIADGAPREVLDDPRVVTAYLGDEAA